MSPTRLRKSATTTSIALLLAGVSLVSLPASAEAATTGGRLAGPDRYATAVAISQRAYPTTAPTVYIARGDILADALAGGAVKDGPVLLVPPTQAPASVLAEVKRLNPAKVIALGGDDVVPNTLLAQVAQGRATGRLAGADRYATAVAISRHVFPTGAPEAYLTSGSVFADAVAGGVLTRGPLLPVSSSTAMPPVVKAELARLKASRVGALGSTSVVSANLLTSAAAVNGSTAFRLGGATRYATSAAIGKYQFPTTASTVYLAKGTLLADAAAGGSLKDGPIFLVDEGVDLTAALQQAKALKPTRVIALGGSDVVSDKTLNTFVNYVNGTSASTPALPAGWTADEYKILQLTNAERTKAGLKAVQPQTCLHTIADEWSASMEKTNTFTHGDFSSRMDRCFNNSYAGENIAKGYTTPEAYVKAWMDSPGHRANILNPNFEYLGVGVTPSGDYATQDFSSHNY